MVSWKQKRKKNNEYKAILEWIIIQYEMFFKNFLPKMFKVELQCTSIATKYHVNSFHLLNGNPSEKKKICVEVNNFRNESSDV